MPIAPVRLVPATKPGRALREPGRGQVRTVALPQAPKRFHVREKPPLELTGVLDTPSGKRFRWSHDESDPANSPSGLTVSSSMPGGHENNTCVLPRKADVDYADLEELTRVTWSGRGGEVAFLGRLETSPRVSGDQLSITPGAVGYIAALDDRQDIAYIYVDADMTRWGDAPLNREVAILGTPRTTGDFSWSTEGGGQVCAMPQTSVAAGSTAELWYLAPASVRLGKAMYSGLSALGFGEAPAFFSPSDDAGTSLPSTAQTLDSTLRSLTVAASSRYAMVRVLNTGTAFTPGAGANRRFAVMAVYADHGLSLHAIDSQTASGLLASDVVAHAIGTWTDLKFTTASTSSNPTIATSSFIIPHLIFPDLGTVTPIVQGATRFELQDYAVWESEDIFRDPTFYMNAYGARGRNWIARVGPSGLNETGPQIDRLWNSVVVQFTDTGGITRFVGPVGSGADVEDSSLTDTDPLNPVNEAGETRRALVTMGVSTPTGAIKVGQAYLAFQKQANTSGQAKIVGYAMEDTGVVWPAWMIRSGDTVTFVDANDPFPRRVVHATYTDDDKTCSIDLDSPPEGLQALLERLGVGLVPTGQGS